MASNLGSTQGGLAANSTRGRSRTHPHRLFGLCKDLLPEGTVWLAYTSHARAFARVHHDVMVPAFPCSGPVGRHAASTASPETRCFWIHARSVNRRRRPGDCNRRSPARGNARTTTTVLPGAGLDMVAFATITLGLIFRRKTENHRRLGSQSGDTCRCNRAHSYRQLRTAGPGVFRSD